METLQQQSWYSNETSNTGSSLYAQISTKKVCEIALANNWQVAKFDSIKAKTSENMSTCQHVIRFDNPSLPTFNGNKVQLVLLNSHDCSKALKIKLGVFRIACANGLIAGDTFFSFVSRHLNLSQDVVNQQTIKAITEAPRLLEFVEKTSNLDCNKDLLYHLICQKTEEKYHPRYLFSPRRFADSATDTWTMFNRAQENILKGFCYKENTKPNSYKQWEKCRAVKSIKTSVKLNEQLFDALETYAQMQ